MFESRGFTPLLVKQENYEYPDIFEDDLKGKVKRIAQNAFRPLMSPNSKHVALFITAASPKSPPSATGDFHYDFFRVNRATLAVLDRDKGQRDIVMKIHETYPDLFWSNDAKKLYVVENIYIFSKKLAQCRISVYDVETKKLKLLGQLEQVGQATSYDDGKLLPYFTPLRIANGRYLLFHVPIRAMGKDNYHVLAVDLTNGEQRNLLAFTSTVSAYKIPEIDWIDS